jgi:hypothetical protein
MLAGQIYTPLPGGCHLAFLLLQDLPAKKVQNIGPCKPGVWSPGHGFPASGTGQMFFL